MQKHAVDLTLIGNYNKDELLLTSSAPPAVVLHIVLRSMLFFLTPSPGPHTRHVNRQDNIDSTFRSRTGQTEVP